MVHLHHTVHMTHHAPKYLTVSQVAELEGVSRWTVVRRIESYRGKVKTDAQYLIPRTSVRPAKRTAA